MPTRASLRRVGRRYRAHNEEGRRCFLYLRIRLVYAADQRVDKLVCRLQGEPFDEELIDLVFGDLEADVPRELTLTQLVHSSAISVNISAFTKEPGSDLLFRFGQ